MREKPPERTYDDFSTLVSDIFEDITYDWHDPSPIEPTLKELIANIISFEEVKWPAHARWMRRSMVTMFRQFFDYVPGGAFRKAYNEPLLTYQIIPNLGSAIQCLYYHVDIAIWAEEAREGICYPKLKGIFRSRSAPMHHKPSSPEQSKLDPYHLVQQFIAGTPFMRLFEMPLRYEEPKLEVPTDLPFSGTWILGSPHSGKTVLLSKLILDRMNEPCSIIVFDTKPELTLTLRDYIFPKQTVVISPDPYLALNPLDLGTRNLDILMTVFGTIGVGFTPKQRQALSQIVYLASKVPNANFNTFIDISANGGKKYQTIIDTFDTMEQEFWSEYPGGQYRETKGEILWRIRSISPPDSLARTMFAAPKTRVNMAQLMDSNSLVIIDATRDILGDDQTEFYGKLFLGMIQAAAEQRARSTKKHPCYVFLDESDTIIGRAPVVADIIYRLRSQKIAFTAANQALRQITEPLVFSALSDCAIRYVSSRHDAPAVAQTMGMKAEDIRALQPGEFALSLRGLPATKVKIPEPSWDYPMASKTDLEARRARFVAEYCYTPAPPSAPPPPPKSDPPEDSAWGKVI